MGMPVLSIDRALAPDEPPLAGGTTATAAASTPTFLSTESLTFPGVSLISLGLVQIWNKATGSPASALEVLVMAMVLGGILIIWGLVGRTNNSPDLKNTVGQVIIGVLNTAVLYGVMLGLAG